MYRDELFDAQRPRGHVPRDEAHLPGAEAKFTESEPDQQSDNQGMNTPLLVTFTSVVYILNAVFPVPIL